MGTGYAAASEMASVRNRVSGIESKPAEQFDWLSNWLPAARTKAVWQLLAASQGASHLRPLLAQPRAVKRDLAADDGPLRSIAGGGLRYG